MIKKLEDYTDKLRTAAIMLAQLYQQEVVLSKSQNGSPLKPTSVVGSRFEEIRNKIVKEMMLVEEQRVIFMKEHDYEMETLDDTLDNEQETHLYRELEKNVDDPSGKHNWNLS